MPFAFDKARKAILLVGGDESDNWTGWYSGNIPILEAGKTYAYACFLGNPPHAFIGMNGTLIVQ